MKVLQRVTRCPFNFCRAAHAASCCILWMRRVPRRPFTSQVCGLEGHTILQVAAGGTHTLALSSTGRIFVWGRGAFGRLGTGMEQDLYAPAEVLLPGGWGVEVDHQVGQPGRPCPYPPP